MNKVKVIAAAVITVFAASVIGTALIMQKPESRVAEVVQDGKVLYTIDLSTVENQSFTVTYEGRSNTITVENGEIYVSAADCPDKICMKTGKLQYEGMPVVCLPNKLIIRFKED
ncbi:MAG: NusG domain II-containing protein [Oscillospiraceae bacterium]|nr:NusG domain II-containing protein [Oscillospiraceae bacterium]